MMSSRDQGSKMNLRSWNRRIGIGVAVFILPLMFVAAIYMDARGQGQPDSQTPVLRLPAMMSDTEPPDGSNAAFVPGEIAVGVRRDAVGAAAVMGEIEARAISAINLAGLDGEDGDAGVDGYLMRVSPGQEWRTIELLQANPAVAFAEPNWIVRAAAVEDGSVAAEIPFQVNDPLYADEQWYLQRVRASRAWALSGKVRAQLTDAPTIRVAVIDSGVDSDHPDLKDVVSLQFENYIDPGQLPNDDCGHGTHVAGLIGAAINNRQGIAGTGADVTLAPYKTLRLVENEDKTKTCSGPVSNITKAIQDAADAGVHIINLSLELDDPWTPLEAAVNYARNKGVLVIAAAGNCVGQQCSVKYPAAYPTVMAIAATGYYDNPASYSSVGNEVDLAAPGGDGIQMLLSTWSADAAAECKRGYRVIDGGSYCENSGTSMSAGVVTGAAALAWSVRPQLSAGDVHDILIDTAMPLPYSRNQVGNGLVDAEQTVRYALRSRLDAQPREFAYRLPIESPAFETVLLLENPSLEPVTWLITSTSGIEWLEVVEPISGTVRYGESARALLVISATHIISGAYRNTFSVEGQRADGSRLVIPITAALDVYTPTLPPELYLPFTGQSPHTGAVWPFVEFGWETPDTVTPGAMGRVERVLPKDSSIGITLPVTITVGGQQFTDARIYSDGYVSLPAAARMERSDNECLPLIASSGMAVFGWWSELDPGRSGSVVSTFQSGPDRFVIEFQDVRVDGGAFDERVSFQIVLYEDGRVRLNYAQMPVYAGAPPKVTVGAQRQDGRFSNQIACVTSAIEVGTIPESYQSILLREGDLF